MFQSSREQGAGSREPEAGSRKPEQQSEDWNRLLSNSPVFAHLAHLAHLAQLRYPTPPA